MFTTDLPYDSSRQETVSLAIAGCGARAQTYIEIASRTPQKFRVVAIADPNPAKRQAVRDLADGMDIQEFESAELLLKRERLADVSAGSGRSRSNPGKTVWRKIYPLCRVWGRRCL